MKIPDLVAIKLVEVRNIFPVKQKVDTARRRSARLFKGRSVDFSEVSAFLVSLKFVNRLEFFDAVYLVAGKLKFTGKVKYVSG